MYGYIFLDRTYCPMSSVCHPNVFSTQYLGRFPRPVTGRVQEVDPRDVPR